MIAVSERAAAVEHRRASCSASASTMPPRNPRCGGARYGTLRMLNDFGIVALVRSNRPRPILPWFN